MEHQSKSRPVKHLDYGHGIKNYVPYQNLNTGTVNNQAQAGSQQQQNTFTPGQTGVQNNLGGLWQSFMQGNIPSSFTNPAAATNAYNTNFDTQVAPGLAAQYGAGSPVIGSQNALGLANLQGQLYNTGVGNFLGALGGGTNYALGMPTGASGSSNQQATQVGNQNQQGGINPLAFLASILGNIGGP